MRFYCVNTQVILPICTVAHLRWNAGVLPSNSANLVRSSKKHFLVFCFPIRENFAFTCWQTELRLFETISHALALHVETLLLQYRNQNIQFFKYIRCEHHPISQLLRPHNYETAAAPELFLFMNMALAPALELLVFMSIAPLPELFFEMALAIVRFCTYSKPRLI